MSAALSEASASSSTPSTAGEIAARDARRADAASALASAGSAAGGAGGESSAGTAAAGEPTPGEPGARGTHGAAAACPGAPAPVDNNACAATLSPAEQRPYLLHWRLYLDSILGYCEGFDSGEDYQCAGALWLARLAVALRPPPAAATREAWQNALTLLLLDIPADARGAWNNWVTNPDILEGVMECAREVAQQAPLELRARAGTGRVGDDARQRLNEVKKATTGHWQRRIQLVRAEAGKVEGGEEEEEDEEEEEEEDEEEDQEDEE